MAFSVGRITSPTGNKSYQRNSSDQVKHKILTQNRALAKKNSVLMTKIADLETRISDLIQQNIELRALNAKNEDKKRKWFEDKLNVIEEGVSQRFEEMFQMFSTIRHNEGLGASSVNLQNIVSNVSHDVSNSDKTVSFQSVKSPKKTTSQDRRRKSARRESMYITRSPQSFPQPLLQDALLQDALLQDALPQVKARSEPQEGHPVVHVQFGEVNPYIKAENPVPVEDDTPLIREEHEYSYELNHAISLSPIKLSTSSPSIVEISSSKSKFSVYEDSPEPDEATVPNNEMQQKIQRLADESVKATGKRQGQEPSDESTDQYKPLEQPSSMIRHAKTKKKTKANVDEEMPSSDVLSTRNSRTRGKQVSYAEPSLRAKMRRQSEKLVDAVAEGNYVKPLTVAEDNLRRKSMAMARTSSILDHSVSLIGQLSSGATERKESASVDVSDASAELTQKISKNQENFLVDVSQSSDESESNFLQESSAMIIESSPNLAVEKSVTNPPVKQRPLTEQDNANITKRRKPLGCLNQNKIQKLDSGDKVKRSKKRFDLSDDELSVFDLVEETSVGVPKTYKNNPDISTKKKGGRRNSMLF
jgi:shugoshin